MAKLKEGQRYLIWATISTGWDASKTQWWCASYHINRNADDRPYWIVEGAPHLMGITFNSVAVRNLPKAPSPDADHGPGGEG